MQVSDVLGALCARRDAGEGIRFPGRRVPDIESAGSMQGGLRSLGSPDGRLLQRRGRIQGAAQQGNTPHVEKEIRHRSAGFKPQRASTTAPGTRHKLPWLRSVLAVRTAMLRSRNVVRTDMLRGGRAPDIGVTATGIFARHAQRSTITPCKSYPVSLLKARSCSKELRCRTAQPSRCLRNSRARRCVCRFTSRPNLRQPSMRLTVRKASQPRSCSNSSRSTAELGAHRSHHGRFTKPRNGGARTVPLHPAQSNQI